MKTRFHNEHVYDTYLDLGVIGEQKTEVFYHWHKGVAFNDRDLPPEPKWAEVVAVLCFIDGKEIDITNLLNQKLIEELEIECAEDYCG